MHQVKVQIIQLQIGQRLSAAGDHVPFGVLIVPQLAGDPEFLARNPAGHNVPKGETDSIFVAVDAGAIEMAVTGLRRIANGIGDLIRRHVVTAECAQSDGGHSGACIKSSAGNQGGIDRGGLHGFTMLQRKAGKC